MNLPYSVQLQLLELQDLVTQIRQVDRKLATSPKAAAVAEKRRESEELRRSLVTSRTRRDDLARDIRRAEIDLDRVRQRRQRDEELLGSGVGAKMQQELAHEAQSLLRRLSELEDSTLELMEEQETLSSALQADEARDEELTRTIATLQEELGEETAALRQQHQDLVAQRDALEGDLPAAALKMFADARNSGGIAAAALVKGQCQGCRLSLPPASVHDMDVEPLDSVEFCEECGCLLVRGTDR